MPVFHQLIIITSSVEDGEIELTNLMNSLHWRCMSPSPATG